MARIILRLAQVKARTGLARTTIYEAVKNGTFPRPVALGARAVGWIDTLVDEWIDSRPLAGSEVRFLAIGDEAASTHVTQHKKKRSAAPNAHQLDAPVAESRRVLGVA